jgi:hypothetical protein
MAHFALLHATSLIHFPFSPSVFLSFTNCSQKQQAAGLKKNGGLAGLKQTKA